MTPAPTEAELALRHIYDPAPGTIHIKDLIRMAKDGVYVKDKLSDCVIGMILHARDIGDILAWQGTLFQLPFVKGMNLRSGYAHYGQPFLGPDDMILTLSGRTLRGSEDNNYQNSPLTKDTITAHPKYQAWLKETLYAGGGKESYLYTQQRAHNTLKECDTYINGRPYTPGPNTKPPSSGSAPPPPAKKKRARGRKRSASPSLASKSPSPSPKPKKRVSLKLRNKRAASPKAEERPSKTAKKGRKRKLQLSAKRILDSQDEDAEDAEADTAEGSYRLHDKEPYYDANEDDPAKDEGGEVAEADAPQREDGEKAESDAPEEEDAEEAGDAEEAEVNAAEGDGGEEAKGGAGGEQAEPDLLEGMVGGDASNDGDYDPSSSKTRKNRATKRKAGVASGRKGKGKARAVN